LDNPVRIVANHGEFETEPEIGILSQQVSASHQGDTFNHLVTATGDIQNPARITPGDAYLVRNTRQNGTELLVISSEVSYICISRLQ
jgi:hypothetical protein